MAIRRDSITLDKLHFHPDRLYGREDEVRELGSVYARSVDRVAAEDRGDTSPTKDIILVSGYSGVGKTSLIESLRGRVRKRGDFFVSGKFDQMTRSVPYSAMIEALSQIPEQVNYEGRRSFLRRSVGAKLSEVIVRCVPGLWPILYAGQAPAESGDAHVVIEDSKSQFTFAFRSFIRSLCEEDDKMLVLFIDDLQCELQFCLRIALERSQL